MGQVDLDCLLQAYNKLHGLLCDYDQEQRLIDQIYQSLQEAVDELPEGAVIGFRPYGDQTDWMIRNFDFSHVRVAGIFDKNVYSKSSQGVAVYEMSEHRALDVDIYIMTSFNWRDEITSELKAEGHCVFDIYEKLEQRGFKLSASPEKFEKGSHVILNKYRNEWKKAGGNKKEEALRKLMTAACEAKDFYMLKELCREWSAVYGWVKRVEEQYKEFYALLRNLMGKRTQRDIIVYWLDAVPYKWRGFFKGLQELSETGHCFHQAYTCTPYTHQSLRAIFSGLLPLNDCEASLEKIGNKNSELIQYLEEKNYKVLHIGHDAPVYEECCIQKDYSVNTSKEASCNAVLWRALCEIAASDVPVFLIAHFVVETHPPMICAELEQLNYVVEEDNYLPQFRIASNYIDKRVMYCHALMSGKACVQIFMSDHGEHTTNQFPDRYWGQHRLHACCFVVGREIQAKKESRIFSYTKFKEFIKWLVEPERNAYEDCLSEYAVFQDTDIYSEFLANRFINRGKAQQALAYRGALDGVYKYVMNAVEQKFFYQIIDDRDVEVRREEAPDSFERLERIAGTDFPDLSIFEKFRFVPRIYEAARKEVQEQE
ncbi:MAG: LTA synthase family protein [Lachnospiraceae bacterium]